MPQNDTSNILKIGFDATGAAVNAAQFNNAADTIVKAAANIDGATKTTQTQIDKTAFSVSALTGKLAAMAAAFGITVTAAAGFRTLSQYDSAVVSLANDSDLAGESLDKFSEEMIRLSRVIPLTATQLVSIASAAGQVGIKGTDNLRTFTVESAKLSAITNIAATEVANGIGRIASSTGRLQDAGAVIKEVGNSIAALSSLGAIARDTLGLGQAIAANVSTAKLPAADIVGIAGAFASVGAESASTGMIVSKFFDTLETSSRKGTRELGYVAAAAGYTREEFDALRKTDPAAAFAAFIAGVGQLNDAGKPIDELLKKLDLVDARSEKALKPLITNWTRMADAINLSREASQKQVALDEQSERQFDTVSAKLALITNAWNASTLAFRNSKGVFADLLGVVAETVSIIGFLENSWRDASIAGRALASVIGIVTAVAGLMFTVKVLSSVTEFTGLVWSAAKAVGALNGSFLAVIGITAIILAAVVAFKYLYDNVRVVQEVAAKTILVFQVGWESVKHGAKVVGESIRFAFESAFRFVIEKFVSLIQSLVNGLTYVNSLLKTNIFNVADAKVYLDVFKQILNVLPAPELDTETLKHEVDAAIASHKEAYNETLRAIERDFNGQQFKDFSVIRFLEENSRGARDALKSLYDSLIAIPQPAEQVSAALNEAGNAVQKLVEIRGPLAFAIERERNGLEKMLDALEQEIFLIGQSSLVRETEIRVAEAREIARKEEIANVEEYIVQLRKMLALKAQAEFDLSIDRGLGDLSRERQLLGFSPESLEVQRAVLEAQREAELRGVQFSQQQATAVETAIRMNYRLREAWNSLAGAAQGVAASFGTFLDTAIFKTDSLASAFQALGRDIYQALVRNIIISPLVNSISGGLQSVFGSFFRPAAGLAAADGAVVPFAAGGIPTGIVDQRVIFPMRNGRVGMAGEYGAEYSVAPVRMPDGRLGVSGVGSSVTVNIYGVSDADSFRRSQRQVVEGIQSALHRSRRT